MFFLKIKTQDVLTTM